jgi:hypothetical protein
MHDFYTEKDNYEPLKGFEHDYAISREGEILSLLTDQIVRPTVNSEGYLKITLWKDGKSYTRRVHRLVAEQFIPNPDNLPVVNHIDGNKKNPHVSNLEWCTQQENVQHAFNTGLTTKTSDKIVVRGDGRVYKSLTEAAAMNNITKSAISKVINGARKTAGGWTWKEVNDATKVHSHNSSDSCKDKEIS